ncbi:MAG: YebC/PmpR family DNA-binding transcriptional regulator [Clostridia bacterium]|nr:YebC/PmpR family DNA-binding transcriptional regulator [Clostridia bacterium]MBR5991943.1 YebC/PmpR family DNA-binding transcriptional regulator [Clostridia bacterium]MBR6512956.1 YebC/PmpR family DNA-binding transcriptional regulator [Clostridia bacterium]
MSGHSKWSTIKRKKGENDAAMAKVFTKIGREIAVAVKEGGADPASNSKLKNVIAKAKAANIPNDNIERAIKKAAGEGSTANYEENIYEGYGPGGIAVLVETLTDNKNRTAGNLRHYFDKYGGNMGQNGCVSFMFSRYGVLAVEKEGVDEETLMDAALEAGAVDFLSDDEAVYEIRTEPGDIGTVRDILECDDYKFVLAEVQYIPSNYTRLEGEDALKAMAKMLEMFEEDDDVQNVWHNWENEEDAEQYM